MRILQINKFFYLKGGPERYMFNLSDMLAAHGHKIAFFSMKSPENVASEWERYFVSNVDYAEKHTPTERIKLIRNILYSSEAEKKLTNIDV